MNSAQVKTATTTANTSQYGKKNVALGIMQAYLYYKKRKQLESTMIVGASGTSSALGIVSSKERNLCTTQGHSNWKRSQSIDGELDMRGNS